MSGCPHIPSPRARVKVLNDPHVAGEETEAPYPWVAEVGFEAGHL